MKFKFIHLLIIFVVVLIICGYIILKVVSLFSNGKRVQKMLSYKHVNNKNQLNNIFLDLFKNTLLKLHFDEDYNKFIFEKNEKIFIVNNQFGDQDSVYYVFYIKNLEVVSEKKIVSFYVLYYTSSDHLSGDEKTYENHIFCHIYYDNDLKPSFATKKAMKEHVNTDTYSLPSLLDYKKAVIEIEKYKK